MDFGQNIIIRQSGIIRVGDKVEILAYKEAKSYLQTTEQTTEPATDNAGYSSLPLKSQNKLSLLNLMASALLGIIKRCC